MEIAKGIIGQFVGSTNEHTNVYMHMYLVSSYKFKAIVSAEF